MTIDAEYCHPKVIRIPNPLNLAKTFELPIPAKFTLVVGKANTDLHCCLNSLRFRSDSAYHSYNGPTTFFGDGLHPSEIKAFVDSHRQIVANAPPHATYVYWTHHPYVVDLFSAADVVAVARRGKELRARALRYHPDYESTWRYGHQTGEFWAAVGEDWVFDPELRAGI